MGGGHFFELLLLFPSNKLLKSEIYGSMLYTSSIFIFWGPSILFFIVQSLICVQLFVTPWTAAHQASLSITNSQSLLKLMCIELVIPSNPLILCCPLLLLPSIFPSIRVFSSESVLHITWPQYWSFTFSISPSMNIQDWFPLGLTGWISLESEGLFCNTTVQKHQFFTAQLLYNPALISIHDYRKNHSFD